MEAAPLLQEDDSPGSLSSVGRRFKPPQMEATPGWAPSGSHLGIQKDTPSGVKNPRWPGSQMVPDEA